MIVRGSANLPITIGGIQVPLPGARLGLYTFAGAYVRGAGDAWDASRVGAGGDVIGGCCVLRLHVCGAG